MVVIQVRVDSALNHRNIGGEKGRHIGKSQMKKYNDAIMLK